MRKVLFIIPSLSGGGAERVFLSLMNKLDRARFEVILCVLRREGPFFSELKDDIGIIDLNTNLKSSLFKIVRTIDNTRPDVVISTLGFLNIVVGFSRFFVRHRKVVFFARESSCPSQRKKIYKNITNSDFIYRLAYKFFDKIICQSDDMYDDVEKLYKIPRSKLCKINNPVDLKKISEMGAESDHNWRLPGKINLLSVGRLSFQKGYDLLLRAISETHNTNLHFHILGEGEEEFRLKALADSLGVNDNVTFHGFKNNPYSYMSTADALVLSSRYEGFPNVLIEAIALGCPIVAFKCPGGVNEIVQQGVNGILVPAEDVSSLAGALDKGEFLSLNRSIISTSVADRFSSSTIVNQYEAAFSVLITNK